MSSLKGMIGFASASSSHLHAFAKFALVGATTAAIYFFAMWLANTIFGFQYIAAVSLAYFISTVFHFLANKHFTFSAGHGLYGNQIARYSLLWFVNYLITIVVVGLCVEKLKFSPYIGVCVSVLITMFVGYVLGRYWVFNLKGDGV